MACRLTVLVCLLSLCLGTFGCAATGRVKLSERTGGNAALFGQFQAYDGHTGRPMPLAEVAQRCATADVVLFGEQHNDAVCNALEAQLLAALAARPRPVALAMEFFEADTQAALDAYLNRRIDEEAYRKQTRQGRAYVLSHRPLLEMCRAAHIPVVAANAPRRLVKAYRTSELDYDAFRADLDSADQRWLPLTSEYLSGPYAERFLGMMRGHGTGGPLPGAPTSQPASQPAVPPQMPPTTQPTSETQPASRPAGPPPGTSPATQPTSQPAMPARMPPQMPPQMPPATQPAAETEPASQPAGPPPGASPERMFRAQLLWDDAMAEALANYRARHRADRVMLIVGVFHVARDGGTVLKFRARQPHDRIVTVVYSSTTDGRFKFDPDDRDAGDIVIYGIAPPPEESETPPMRPGAPAATQPAATQPSATQPTESQPASAPAPAASMPTTDPAR